MNEILNAAKAVIDCWDRHWPIESRIKRLKNAVDRAEKQEFVGFEEWWTKQNLWDWYVSKRDSAEMAWTAAQQAERERCREIVITMGGPDVPDLLRQIDSGED